MGARLTFCNIPLQPFKIPPGPLGISCSAKKFCLDRTEVCPLLLRNPVTKRQRCVEVLGSRELAPRSGPRTSAAPGSSVGRKGKGISFSWVDLRLGNVLSWTGIELTLPLIHSEQHQAKLLRNSLTSHSGWESRDHFFEVCSPLEHI